MHGADNLFDVVTFATFISWPTSAARIIIDSGLWNQLFDNQTFFVIEWRQWNTLNMVVFFVIIPRSIMLIPPSPSSWFLHDSLHWCCPLRGSSTSAERHKFRPNRGWWICARLKVEDSLGQTSQTSQPSQTSQTRQIYHHFCDWVHVDLFFGVNVFWLPGILSTPQTQKYIWSRRFTRRKITNYSKCCSFNAKFIWTIYGRLWSWVPCFLPNLNPFQNDEEIRWTCTTPIHISYSLTSCHKLCRGYIHNGVMHCGVQQWIISNA